MAYESSLPVDRGWAWVVLIACTMETFIMFGTMKSFGILFVEFLQEYGIDAATMSLVLSVKTIAYSVTSPFVMSVGLLYVPARLLIMIGSLIQCMAYLIIAYTPGVDALFLTLGVMWGVSEPLIHGPILIILGEYFDKKRGFANTFANTGSSFGALSFPPLLRFLLDKYNIGGTLLILSGIYMNLLVICSLLRPQSYYTKQSCRIKEVNLMSNGKEEEIEEIMETSTEPFKLSENHNYDIDLSHIKYENMGDQSKEEHTYIPIENGGSLAKHDYKILDKTSARSTLSEKVRTNDYRIGTDVYRSMSINSLVIAGSIGPLRSNNTVVYKQSSVSEGNKTTCSILLKKTTENLLDKDLLKNKLFLLYCISSFLGIIGCSMISTFIPPFADDLGISETDIPVLLIVAATVDIAGRICVAFLADRGFIKRHQILVIAFIITGVACHMCQIITSYVGLIIFCTVFGFFGGIFFCLFPVVLVDFVGIDKMANGLGISLLVHGTSISVLVPVLGAIRDSTGSYVGSFHLMGASQLLAGVLLLLEPLARK